MASPHSAAAAAGVTASIPIIQPVIIGSHYSIPFYHPEGKLDVSIRDNDGSCVVSEISKQSSLFQKGDIIDSMDGLPMFGLGLRRCVEMIKETEGRAWRLFQVRRLLPGSRAASVAKGAQDGRQAEVVVIDGKEKSGGNEKGDVDVIDVDADADVDGVVAQGTVVENAAQTTMQPCTDPVPMPVPPSTTSVIVTPSSSSTKSPTPPTSPSLSNSPALPILPVVSPAIHPTDPFKAAARAAAGYHVKSRTDNASHRNQVESQQATPAESENGVDTIEKNIEEEKEIKDIATKNDNCEPEHSRATVASESIKPNQTKPTKQTKQTIEDEAASDTDENSENFEEDEWTVRSRLSGREAEKYWKRLERKYASQVAAEAEETTAIANREQSEADQTTALPIMNREQINAAHKKAAEEAVASANRELERKEAARKAAAAAERLNAARKAETAAAANRERERIEAARKAADAARQAEMVAAAIRERERMEAARKASVERMNAARMAGAVVAANRERARIEAARKAAAAAAHVERVIAARKAEMVAAVILERERIEAVQKAIAIDHSIYAARKAEQAVAAAERNRVAAARKAVVLAAEVAAMKGKKDARWNEWAYPALGHGVGVGASGEVKKVTENKQAERTAVTAAKGQKDVDLNERARLALGHDVAVGASSVVKPKPQNEVKKVTANKQGKRTDYENKTKMIESARAAAGYDVTAGASLLARQREGKEMKKKRSLPIDWEDKEKNKNPNNYKQPAKPAVKQESKEYNLPEKSKSKPKAKPNYECKSIPVYSQSELKYLPDSSTARPGYISPDRRHYCTKIESLLSVSEKLGLLKFQDLANVPFNVERYGRTSANSVFKAHSILRIPTELCSGWKLSQLVDHDLEELEKISTCLKCGVEETAADEYANEMLLCDGCDAAYHMKCAGLSAVPEGDWLCGECLDVLKARRERYHCLEGAGSAEEGRRLDMSAEPPELPQLSPDVLEEGRRITELFRRYGTARKERALLRLQDRQKSTRETLEASIAAFSGDDPQLEAQRCKEQANYMRKLDDFLGGVPCCPAKRHAKERLDRQISINGPTSLSEPLSLNSPHTQRYLNSLWESERNRQRSYIELQTLRWPLTSVEKQIQARQDELKDFQRQQRHRDKTEQTETEQLLADFAALLSEPQLPFERQKAFLSRGRPPSLLGFYRPETALDVRVLYTLREPTEIIIAVPLDWDENMLEQEQEKEQDEISIGRDYAIFGLAVMFQSIRDDGIPMDFSEGSVRWAQKRLVIGMRADKRNAAAVVTDVVVPDSVRVRGVGEGNGNSNLNETQSASTSISSSSNSKFFDLSELVRDCTCPLDTPTTPTPQRLAHNGLVLRDYQKASLQWMLDKERNPTKLGVAGELWSRMQFLDGSGAYYYCSLTGSFASDIYNFRYDVKQNDVTTNNGSLPVGGILGEEMGLGKTVICIALIVANPPPKHNRMLPREHLATITHPSYVMPPLVPHINKSTRQCVLSNATLVVAPMTLCSQWQSEVEKFAPWMSVITLHSSEKTNVNNIASKDLVIVSTFLLHSQHSRNLLRMIKKIHFHRIFLDESHYNQAGVRIKDTLGTLSSTYRYCVTGTPIGHSLDDLQGQLRFLRIPQFCRMDFWTRNISTPYYDRSYDSLRVLRCLLSHLVVRHSKEQTLHNGKAMLNLPSRTVETVLLSFGSDAESKLYQELEARNTKRFMELRKESPQTVLSKYMELTGMVYTTRQACGHASLVNLDNIHNHNVSLEVEKRKNGHSYHADHNNEKPVEAPTTRAGILARAIKNARPSAQDRMREAVLLFHEGSVEFMQCSVCLEPTGEADIALTPCAHKFCAECLLNVLDGASSTRQATGRCPQCREIMTRSELTFLGHAKEANENSAMVTTDEGRKPEIKNVDTEINGFHLLAKDVHTTATGSNIRRVSYEFLTPLEKRQQRACSYTLSQDFLNFHEKASSCIGTKTSRLLEEIKAMMTKNRKSKCVVFSQFLGTLDVIAEELTVRDIRFVRVDGHMKQHQRADALLEFSSDPNICVFLLSMRAGAAGLNLVAADHCFIFDAPMNSAVEEQAIDRIHRIGQTRPVIVKRFIIKNSVEERILSSRRELAADRLQVSTQIDGAGIMANEQSLLERPSKRVCLENTNSQDNRTSQRLKLLESLFGYSAVIHVTKA